MYTTEQLTERFEDRREMKNLMGKFVTSCLLCREALRHPDSGTKLWSRGSSHAEGRQFLMNKNLSLEDRVWNCAASLQAEFLHSTHSYYHAKAMGVEEFSELWSRSENISWAHGFGRMRGFSSVWNGLVMLYDIQASQRLQQNFEAMPEIAGFDMRALMELSLHALATDIIEVADDGKSARSSFLTPGLISSAVTDNGKRRLTGLWERYGADYVYEDGCWLYLHEHVCPDISVLRLVYCSCCRCSFAVARPSHRPESAGTK